MMHPLKQRPDLTQEAYQALRDAILDGELPPGAPLAQESLAARLGVSRQPVLQALGLLKREGLVVERGRRGLAVAAFEPERIRDLYQVRAALDGLAARLAAKRGADPSGLEPILARGEAALAEEDLHATILADIAFHDALYALCGNPETARAAAPLWPHFRRAMAAVLRAPDPAAGRGAQSWREHREIVAAVAAGDAETAENRAREHCLVAGEATLKRLRRIEESGA